MAGIVDTDLKQFFERSATFDGERVRAAARSQRLAWVLAGTSTALCAASMLAVIAMLPLRTVETRVIRVNESTGSVDLMTPVVGTQTYTEATTKHFIADYIRAREWFLYEEAPFAFRKVNLMSAEPEQARFSASYVSTNPKSALALLGRDGTATIDIKAISFPSANLALIRFARVVHKGSLDSVTHYLGTLAYEFQSAPLSEADILLNPLGFTVRAYRLDTETP